MSSPRILRRIRTEFDYEDYVQEHYSTKKTSRVNEIRICCPSCGDDNYKLYINNEKKKFNCYKCDFTSGNYDVFDFVAITEAIPRGKAMLRLAHEFAPTTPLTMEEMVEKLEGRYIDVDEDEPGASSDIKTIDSVPKDAYPLTGLPDDLPIEKPFWEYLLQERGLTVAEVWQAKMHCVPASKVPIYKVSDVGESKYVGDIGRRILIPVYGPAGRLISWQTRPISNDYEGPKYVNSPGSEINRTLWPFVEPHVASAVIVEGVLDCLAVRRLGAPFSPYATFTKKISHDQIQHLKDWGVKDVTILWDPEAKQSTIRAVEELKMHFTVTVPDFSEWPGDKDPGNMLTEPDGIVHLEKALCNPISVDSLDYVAWQIR